MSGMFSRGVPRFDAAYSERAELKDGTVVELRFVRPSDAELLRRGFQRLSPRSRYRRFFETKRALSDRDLHYLTNVDGVDHVAIGATTTSPDGSVEGLGIARFVRLADQPCCAEAAVAVVDEAQHQGLGSVLLNRLVAAARERGIDCFVAHVQRDNTAMRALLARIPELDRRPLDSETTAIQLRLRGDAAGVDGEPASELREFFRMAAGERVSVLPGGGTETPDRPDLPG